MSILLFLYPFVPPFAVSSSGVDGASGDERTPARIPRRKAITVLVAETMAQTYKCVYIYVYTYNTYLQMHLRTYLVMHLS